MRNTFGQLISYAFRSGIASINVFGVGGGGAGPSPVPSWGRKVNGTPKILTYSGSKKPVSGFTSYDALRNPRPTTCSHKSCDVNARKPMMCVTVFASHPSESMPTEITF